MRWVKGYIKSHSQSSPTFNKKSQNHLVGPVTAKVTFVDVSQK